MKIIEKAIMAIGILVFSVKGFSQERDTISNDSKDSLNVVKRAQTYAADKFAITRPLNIEYTNTAPYKFTSERGNNSLPESEVTSFNQFKVSANYDFIKKKTWLLGASFEYKNTNIEADMTDPFSGNITTIDKDFNYFSSSLNFTYFSTLFKKRVIYNSRVIVDGSEKHFERLKGLLTGVMVLKANQKTKMIAGLAVNIDPSAQIPVIPIFTYEYKFNNGLVADITLPKSAYLRKYMFNNSGRFSLGVELDRTSFYLYNVDGTSQRYEYRQTDINPGLMYEHAIGNFVITGKTGLKMTRAARLFRKQDSFKDAVFEAEPDPSFYFNVGVSFNPFTLLKKSN